LLLIKENIQKKLELSRKSLYIIEVKLRKIAFKNFRNFGELHYEFPDGLNMIVGANGVGKTNLLEGIAFLSHFRSFRGAKLKEMINFNSTYYSLIGEAEKNSGEKITIETRGADTHNVKINGVKLDKITTAFGQIMVVPFTSYDISFVDGTPAERRKFLDITASEVSLDYLDDLIAYKKLLFQRNKLLIRANETGKIPSELDAWDNSLVKVGARIVKKRLEVVQRIKPKAKYFFNLFDVGEMDIIYIPSFKLIGDIERNFIAGLKSHLKRDIVMEVTSVGPHRDRLNFTHIGRDVKKFSSLGSKRALAFALRMAEAEIIKEIKGDYPILILDEITGELDKTRVYDLMEIVVTYPQTFIATPREEIIEGSNINVHKLEIENGTPKIERLNI